MTHADKTRGEKASRFLREVEQGRYLGVVSTFTVEEYVGAMKEILAGKIQGTPSPNAVMQIRANIDNLVDSLGLELADSDLLLVGGFGKPDIVKAASQVIDQSEVYHKPTCKWIGVGAADALTTVLAQRSGSQFLATLDDGFRGVKSAVQPFMIEDSY